MTAIVGAAIGLLITGPVASGAESASRIVDRTISCRVAGEGFPDRLRFMSASASPRLGSRSPGWNVYGGPSGADAVSASLRTGPDFFGEGTGLLHFSRISCKPTKLRVRLSSTGLRGGPTRLGDRHKCEVPARILIRIRALFRRPVTLRRDGYTMVAKGRIATGEVVVTTDKRSPIAFASVDDATGKAQIFVAPSRCVPES